jgi:hypothetical protein
MLGSEHDGGLSCMTTKRYRRLVMFFFYYIVSFSISIDENRHMKPLGKWHRTKTNKTKQFIQKTKEMSNTDPHQTN